MRVIDPVAIRIVTYIGHDTGLCTMKDVSKVFIQIEQDCNVQLQHEGLKIATCCLNTSTWPPHGSYRSYYCTAINQKSAGQSDNSCKFYGKHVDPEGKSYGYCIA